SIHLILEHRIGDVWQSLYRLTRTLAVNDILERLDAMAAGIVRGHETSISEAKQWLDQCCKSHSKCGSNVAGGASTWYPTRLLHVMKDNGTEKMIVRLQNSNEEAPSGPYITLSHRWGGTNPFRLTKDNMSACLREINLDCLPKTFQDALKVCLDLKLHYLWIDSLCIIQDSTEDWQSEASSMQKVYQNGLLNISATSPRCLRDGLFFDRQPEKLETLVYEIPEKPDNLVYRMPWEAEREEEENQRFFLQMYFNDQVDEGRYKEQMNELVNKAPLNKRGWVVQERFLSKRILHFTSGSLVWECNELQTWEKPWPSESSESLESLNLIERELIPIGTTYDKDKLHQLWMEVLKRYSSCGITLASDKMIALSGVASAFQLLLDDEYYAGVWKSNYARQLCWRAARSKRSYRPTPYRAPSWSWASVEAQVEDIDPYISSNLVELIEIKTSLVSADFKTGPVTSGSVTLSARLIPSGHWEPYIEPTKKHSSSSTALPWAAPYKGGDILIYSRGESFTNVFPDDESDFDPQRMVISYVPILSHVFMVSLAVCEVGEAALDSEPTTAVYRRVGVCEIHLRSGSPEERDKWLEPWPKTRITII
ncbi:hypothetical protein Egran_06686, partial [Elaphomyces granulatus]